MVNAPYSDPLTLMHVLEELQRLVMEGGMQPVHQLAENAVMYWLRVVEGKESVLPRLRPDGRAPKSFPFGLETRRDQRLDGEPRISDAAAMHGDLARRLAELTARIEEFEGQGGYRSSSDQCDLMMVVVGRVSRYLSQGVCDAERSAARGSSDGPTAGGEEGTAAWLVAAWDSWFTWEPALNDVVVAWEQNSLTDFEQALTTVKRLLALPETERAEYRMPAGFPLRPRGRRRLKVVVTEPAPRPARSKSMFNVRYSQLARVLETVEELPASVCVDLEEDMRHFIGMVRRNRFLLAHEPSFWGSHRPGLPVIRGAPSSHPFLLDPLDFFKRAVLFHNRTYTVAGGGIDSAYLQVAQLERYTKFQSPGSGRAIRPRIEACLRAWDENRWEGFTAGLLELAEHLRHAPPAPTN